MNKKVIIIEDEELIALDLQNRLNKRGFDTFVAHTKAEAIELYKEHFFTLGLVDISLKEESGIETVEELYEVRNFPVIYITAYDDDEIISQIHSTTPYGYILKPFDEKELFFAITIALEKAKRLAELENKNYWITSVVDSITDLIIVTDTDNKVNFVNSMAQKYFNISADYQNIESELVFLDNENYQFDPNFFQTVIEKNTPVVFSKVAVKSIKNGKELKATCSFVPLKENKQDVGGVVITVKKNE